MKKRKEYLAGRFAIRTDIGKVRLTNEDRAIALTNARGNALLLVCDGMGGQNKGDYAATLASNYISESFMSHGAFLSRFSAVRWASKVARDANKLIYEEANEKETYNGMGTTLSMILIINNYYVTIHAGDSRIYFVNQNHKLNQITEDQTYVNYLFKTGQIKKEEMRSHPKRHVLMNALGVYPCANFDIKLSSYHKEKILLCSDGLYNNVSDSTIESILVSTDSPEEKVTKLITIGNANGGSDNIACIVWEAY